MFSTHFTGSFAFEFAQFFEIIFAEFVCRILSVLDDFAAHLDTLCFLICCVSPYLGMSVVFMFFNSLSVIVEVEQEINI